MGKRQSNNSEERWSGLSFVVHRNSQGSMDWTLVHRRAAGGRRWDRRLGWGRLECRPGSPESQDALAALAACLRQACRRETPGGGAAPPTSPEGSAPPGGPRGDTPQGS